MTKFSMLETIISLSDIEDHINELRGLLIECAPHVEATVGAEHMLDGFGGRKECPSDDLAGRVKAMIESFEEHFEVEDGSA